MACPNCTCPACVAKRSAEALYLEQAMAICAALVGEDEASKLTFSIMPASCMPKRHEAER